MITRTRRTPTRAAMLGMLCLAVLALAALTLTAWFALTRESADPRIPGTPSDAFPLTVESVHDGDTLRVRIDEPNSIITDRESTRVRLIGVDTPEISPEPECWGAEATTGLTALLPPGSTMWATADEEILDRYGRHLLYLWTTDGTFVNAELVAQGDGEVMIFAPNDHHEPLLRELESEAAAAGRGLWGSC